MPYFFTSYSSVARHQSALAELGFDVGELLSGPMALPEGTPSCVDECMRPREPMCSYFFDLARHVGAKSLREYASDLMGLEDSSRSSARRAETCADQPCRRISCHAPHRVPDVEEPGDQRTDSTQRPALVLLPAVRRRITPELPLQPLPPPQARPLHRVRPTRTQRLHTALPPGLAPVVHLPHANPQLSGDIDGLLAALEPLRRVQPPSLPRLLTLRGQPATLRIPRPYGIPQGSRKVSSTRHYEFNLRVPGSGDRAAEGLDGGREGPAPGGSPALSLCVSGRAVGRPRRGWRRCPGARWPGTGRRARSARGGRPCRGGPG